jgi:hypothetical protein
MIKLQGSKTEQAYMGENTGKSDDQMQLSLNKRRKREGKF